MVETASCSPLLDAARRGKPLVLGRRSRSAAVTRESESEELVAGADPKSPVRPTSQHVIPIRGSLSKPADVGHLQPRPHAPDGNIPNRQAILDPSDDDWVIV